MDGLGCLLFGSAEFRADSGALPELAREGVYGIEIMAMFAVMLMACFFFWSYCKREARRDDELLTMGNNWSSAIHKLTLTLQRYVDCTSSAFIQIKESVAKISDGIESVGKRIEESEITITEHGVRLDEHDKRFGVIDGALADHNVRLDEMEIESAVLKEKIEGGAVKSVKEGNGMSVKE